MALARRAMLPQVSGSSLSDKPTTVLGSIAFAYPYNLSIASQPRFIESRLRPAATRFARFANPVAIFRSSVIVMCRRWIVGPRQSAALIRERVVNLADEFESPLRILFDGGLGAKLFPTFRLFLHSLLLLFGDGIRVGANIS